MSDLLKSINSPRQLQTLTISQLEMLAEEIRELILTTVSQNGGHLASNLGVVELTVALHYCFDFEVRDRLIWDVGHQAYTHKILTGRRESFHTLRQEGGISGYADRKESSCDTFSFGHTGTSISAALGMACANDSKRFCDHIVAVIGDGAIASGMPLEAMNHAGELRKNLLLILNDNQMSISPTVGGLAKYLSKIRSSAAYVGIKHEAQELISHWKAAFKKIDTLYERLADGVQSVLTPGGLFTELGFQYYGPVEGNDMAEIVDTLQHVKRIDGPVLLHTLTTKGKGFEPACSDPASFHSSKSFIVENGQYMPDAGEDCEAPEPPAYWSRAAGAKLVALAEQKPELVAITAAMPEGTGLTEFAEKYPDRFFDVGICEQHAVGLAGGMAAGGLRPVICIYSSFLQRAYDQIFHDIALQGWPAVFCIDRAGLVGSDGPSHHGLHDIAFMRGMPGCIVMAPCDRKELHSMLELALTLDQPCAIRYPREPVTASLSGADPDNLEPGKAQLLKEGSDGVFIAYGAAVPRALKAAELLEKDGKSTAVINARFAKPLDIELIGNAVQNYPATVLAEDHSIAGGFCSAVLEALNENSIPSHNIHVAAVPDRFITHAERDRQLISLELDGEGLARRMKNQI